MCDTGDVIEDYCVLDPAINLSDHLPVVIRCRCVYMYSDCLPAAEATRAPKVKQLRWDHADLLQHYNTTVYSRPTYDQLPIYFGAMMSKLLIRN